MDSKIDEAGSTATLRLGRRAAVWLLLAAAAAATAAVYVTRPVTVQSSSMSAQAGTDERVAPGTAATGSEPRLIERLDHSVVERTGTTESQDSTGASVAAYGQ